MADTDYCGTGSGTQIIVNGERTLIIAELVADTDYCGAVSGHILLQNGYRTLLIAEGVRALMQNGLRPLINAK